MHTDLQDRSDVFVLGIEGPCCHAEAPRTWILQSLSLACLPEDQEVVDPGLDQPNEGM